MGNCKDYDTVLRTNRFSEKIMSYFWHIFPRGIYKYRSGPQKVRWERFWGWREKKTYIWSFDPLKMPTSNKWEGVPV